MPTATNPPSPAAADPSLPSQPTLPPPQTFDFLPPLHAILSRLLLPSNPNLSTILDTSLESQTSPAAAAEQPLSPKDITTASLTINAKIQKARVAVKGLSGIEMGLDEQEEMISQLEAEVLRGKGVLEGIRAACARASASASGCAVGDGVDVGMEERD